MEAHFTEVHEAIAGAVPDREAIVWRDRRFTNGQLAERSRRLAGESPMSGDSMPTTAS